MADTRSKFPLGRNSGKKKTTVVGLVFAVLIGGYTMFRPAINQATGWNLPSISNRDARPNQDAPVARKSETPSDSRGQSSPAESGVKTPVAVDASEPDVSNADASLKYGLLQEVSPKRFMSPEGLLYTPGSAEGHRLEHLKRHTVDQPSRPGKHGVFDGGMEGALKSIEKAYQKAKADQRTTKQVDGNRTIYTVDMGKRIGFVGGRDGNQKRKPMARRLRMVLEGNRVITAFPL